MSELPQDAWFYSHEGERIGPVSFAELRVKAQQATLNPRLDLVWTHGMAEWQPAGQIDGLFDKRAAPAAPESLAPPTLPYTPPQHELAPEMMGREGDWPGARRRSFLIATLLFPGVWSFCLPAGLEWLKQPFGEKITGVIGIGAAFLPLVVVLYYGLMRLVNLGMSRWWYLANFVPFLNVWLGYRCFACPGGYAYHKKLDGVGVFLAILYWLLIAIGLLVMAALVALTLGSLGNSELIQQCRDALHNVLEASSKP